MVVNFSWIIKRGTSGLLSRLKIDEITRETRELLNRERLYTFITDTRKQSRGKVSESGTHSPAHPSQMDRKLS